MPHGSEARSPMHVLEERPRMEGEPNEEAGAVRPGVGSSEREPDVFLVGTARFGTTSFAARLGEHEHAFVTDPKEPDLFSRDIGSPSAIRDERHYRALFRGATSRQLAVGEGSTTFLRSRVAVPAILERYPAARASSSACATRSTWPVRCMLSMCARDVSRCAPSSARGVYRRSGGRGEACRPTCRSQRISSMWSSARSPRSSRGSCSGSHARGSTRCCSSSACRMTSGRTSPPTADAGRRGATRSAAAAIAFRRVDDGRCAGRCPYFPFPPLRITATGVRTNKIASHQIDQFRT